MEKLNVMRKIGAAIRRSREKLGLTQEELGSRVGVSGNTVYLWESGRSGIKLETLQAVADALGCSLEDLVRDGARSGEASAPRGTAGRLGREVQEATGDYDWLRVALAIADSQRDFAAAAKLAQENISRTLDQAHVAPFRIGLPREEATAAEKPLVFAANS